MTDTALRGLFVDFLLIAMIAARIISSGMAKFRLRQMNLGMVTCQHRQCVLGTRRCLELSKLFHVLRLRATLHGSPASDTVLSITV